MTTLGQDSDPYAIAPARRVFYLQMALPLMLAVLLWFAVDSWEQPESWVVIVQVAVAPVALLVAELVGFRTAAIPPGTPREAAQRQAVTAWRTTGFMRMAITESVVLIGLCLSFVVESRWPLVIGLLLGWPLMAYEMLLSRRITEKLKRSLERDGGQSYLDEAMQGTP